MSGQYGSVGECKLCPEGKTSDEDRINCRDCKVGHQCLLQEYFKVETPCPINTFSPGGRESCTACPRKQVSEIGAAECDYCPISKGYDYKSKTCEFCSFGRFSQNGMCELCPIGQVSTDDTRTSCRDCQAGHRCIYGGEGKIEVPCPSNTYSTGGSDECLRCEGSISEPGSSECSLCSNGTGFNQEVKTCTRCSDGTFSTNGLCELCPDGEWHDADHMSCISCAAGHKCTVAGNKKILEICPINHFSAGGSSVCEPCPLNYIADAGATVCVACPLGQGFDDNSNSCVLCPAGSYGEDSSQCTKIVGPIQLGKIYAFSVLTFTNALQRLEILPNIADLGIFL